MNFKTAFLTASLFVGLSLPTLAASTLPSFPIDPATGFPSIPLDLKVCYHKANFIADIKNTKDGWVMFSKTFPNKVSDIAFRIAGLEAIAVFDQNECVVKVLVVGRGQPDLQV